MQTVLTHQNIWSTWKPVFMRENKKPEPTTNPNEIFIVPEPLTRLPPIGSDHIKNIGSWSVHSTCSITTRYYISMDHSAHRPAATLKWLVHGSAIHELSNESPAWTHLPEQRGSLRGLLRNLAASICNQPWMPCKEQVGTSCPVVSRKLSYAHKPYHHFA